MAAVVFLVRTLIALYLFAVLMRLLLQWVRADFRNPLAQALIQITNPALIPLRRLFPAINRMDTASVVLVVVLVMLKVAIGPLLSGGGLPPLLVWLQQSLLQLNYCLAARNITHGTAGATFFSSTGAPQMPRKTGFRQFTFA